MKKTETRIMLELCKEGIQDSIITDAYIEEMKELALKDPIEFQDLINIFNEEKQNEGFILCILAEVLVTLKWLPIKKYFYEVINFSKNLGYKIIAAEYLIDMHDKNVFNYLPELTKEAYKNNDDYKLWSISLIFVKANTPESAKLFLKLEEQYSGLMKQLSLDAQKKIHKLAKDENI